MKVSALDHRNAKEVAELMHRIKPDWWPSAADAYGQLTDLSETIGTIGWVLEDDSGRPVGWTLFRELKGYLTLELECSGYDDHGVFKLEHKLKDLLDTAVAYAGAQGFTALRNGMSSVGFNIDGKPLEDIPEAMRSLSTERVDYHWMLDYGFRVVGIQPNVYRNNCHLILLVKELYGGPFVHSERIAGGEASDRLDPAQTA